VSKRIVVELDGSQHRGSVYDRARDAYMHERGWTVLRFWAWDVVSNLEGTINAIADTVATLADPPILKWGFAPARHAVPTIPSCRSVWWRPTTH
jgi:hypothetical protein